MFLPPSLALRVSACPLACRFAHSICYALMRTVISAVFLLVASHLKVAAKVAGKTCFAYISFLLIHCFNNFNILPHDIWY